MNITLNLTDEVKLCAILLVRLCHLVGPLVLILHTIWRTENLSGLLFFLKSTIKGVMIETKRDFNIIKL